MRRIDRPLVIRRAVRNLAGVLDPFYPTSLYSMRLRNGAYVGPCCRVRRSSDNAEQDIGFDGNGWCDAVALAAFVGVNSGYVSVWYDQSGSGVHAVEATTTLQPGIVASGTITTMAGKPALNFQAQGSGRLRVTPGVSAFGYGTAAFTWEAFAETANPVSASGANNPLINQRGSMTGADPAELYITDSSTTLIAWYYGSNINSSTTPAVSTQYHFAASYVGGAASALRVFLAGATVINSNITMNFGSTDELAIGMDTQSWRGRIGEIAITKGQCLWTADFTPRSYT